MQKVPITEDKLLYSIRDVANQAKLLNADVIVAIERGGLPLATYLSFFLNVPLERIRVSFYKDTEEQSTPIVDLKNFDIKKYKNPIFVDDLVDSGDTLKYIKDTYGNVTYATICASDTLKSDIYSFIKPKEEWIVFPWDQENDGFDYSFAVVGWWNAIA